MLVQPETVPTEGSDEFVCPTRLTQLVAQYGLGETKAFADHHAEQANLENRYLLELLRRGKPLAVEKRCLEGIEFLRRGNQEAD
jgi:hypothetical protein